MRPCCENGSTGLREGETVFCETVTADSQYKFYVLFQSFITLKVKNTHIKTNLHKPINRADYTKKMTE